MMKSLLTTVSVLAAFTLAQNASAISYSGSLSTSGGIVTGGKWSGDTISLGWTVTDTGADLDSGWWRYTYTWHGQTPGLSHAIIELSPNVTEADFEFWDLETEIKTFGSGPSNPGIPGSIFGVKIDDIGESSFVFSFDSSRAPVWGDFYAKGGGGPQTSYAYNAGFLNADPVAAAANGSIANHILRPDTMTTSTTSTGVPDVGSTALLLGVGAVVLGSLRGRFVA